MRFYLVFVKFHCGMEVLRAFRNLAQVSALLVLFEVRLHLGDRQKFLALGTCAAREQVLRGLPVI